MTSAERKRAYYAENYAGGYHMNGQPVHVPDDVVRLTEHEPCWMCGTARGLCRHRKLVA